MWLNGQLTYNNGVYRWMQCLQKDKKGDESATGDGWTSDDKKAILITERVSDENMSGQEMAKIRRGNLESVI
jgi:hypothetical protein